MAASPDVPHAQWAANTMDWNTLIFEAFDARGTTKRRKPGSNSCQAPGCNVDLSDAKPYFKRHCICSIHMKAPYVMMNGVNMRYCQQCGHFETLEVFVGPNRSCKMSLERRSAMAQHSKQKNGRSERARDQQISKMSVSDDSSSDKGGGMGGKSSVCGSPTELKQSDIDKKGTTSKIAGRDQFSAYKTPCRTPETPPDDRPAGGIATLNPYIPVGGQARDVDMFADSTAATNQGPTFSFGHQSAALEAPLPAPVFSTAATSGAYFSAPGRLLPPAAPSLSSGATVALGALNLQQDSSGAASSGVGATGMSADYQRLVMQLTHRSSALSQGQSSTLKQSLPSQLFMDSAGGTSRDGFGGGSAALSSKCSTGIGAAFSSCAGRQRTAPTQMANGPSWKPGSVETCGGGSAYMQASCVNNLAGSATRYQGLGGSGGPITSLAENLLWEDPRPPLYSTATAPALHSMADSLAGIQDAGLEQQLQDILQSTHMEGAGWFGDGGIGAGGSSTVSGAMARSGAPPGWDNGSGLGPAWKGGVEGGGNGAYGMNGNAGIRCSLNKNTMGNGDGPASLGVALQFTNLGARGAASLAAAEPYTGQYAGATSSLLSAAATYTDNNGSTRQSSMAAAFQRNTGGPTMASTGPPGCTAGMGPQLCSGGGASSTSSSQTCMAYLQQQQRGRGGMSCGAAEPLIGAQVRRTMLAYRSGEPDPLVRVALKLTSRSPDELDSVTLASLRKLLSVYDRLQSMQGYVRPGCTHLIIDAHRAVGFPCGEATLSTFGSGSGGNLPGLAVHPPAGGGACSGPLPAVLQYNLAANGPTRSATCSGEQPRCGLHGGTLHELPDAMAQRSSTRALEAEAVLQQLASVCWEGRDFLGHQAMLEALMQIATSNHTALTMQLGNLTVTVREDGSLGTSRRLEDLPTIFAASCVAVSADDIATEVTLYGAHLQAPGVTVWARMHGVCYQLQTRSYGDDGVAVRLPLLIACGLLQLEACREDPAFSALGPSYPLLVLPNAAAVGEVHTIAGAMGPASLRRFVADLGVLLGTGALLSQPLNGVVPVRSAATAGPSPSQPGTWGSTESELHGGGEGAAQHLEQGPTCLLGAGPGGATLVAEMFEQAHRQGGSSRSSSLSGSLTNSGGSLDFRLMNGDPTEGMSNADDEQVVEQLLNANAVESLLESALALLQVMVERSMPHCLTAVVASLAELHERFPDRIHCGMLSPHLNRSSTRPSLQLAAAVNTTAGLTAAKRPQGEANDDTGGGEGGGHFGLMHVAARAGDLHALVTLGSLEGVLGEQCSLLLRGVAGVTPLHLLAMLPDAPRMLRSLQRLFPGIEQALTTARADDGLTPLLLYQMVHPSLPNNVDARVPIFGGLNMAGDARTESWDASRTVVGVAAISAPGNIYTRSFSDEPRLMGDDERFTGVDNVVKNTLDSLPPRALTSHLLGGMQSEVTDSLAAICLQHDLPAARFACSTICSIAAIRQQHPGSHQMAIVDERIPTDMLLAAASSEVFSEEWKSVEASEGSRGSSICGCDTPQGYQTDFLGIVESGSDGAAFLAATTGSDIGGLGICMTNPASAVIPPCTSVTSATMMAVDAAVRSRSVGRPVAQQGWAGAAQPVLPPTAGYVTPPPPPQRPSGGQVGLGQGQAAGAADMQAHAASAIGASLGVPTGRVVSAVMMAPGAAKPVMTSEVFTTNKQKGQSSGSVPTPITYCTAPADSDDGSTDDDGSGTTRKLEPSGAPTCGLLGTAAATAEASEPCNLAQSVVAMDDRRTARTGAGSTAAAGTSAAAEAARAAKPVLPNSSHFFAAAAPLLALTLVALVPKMSLTLAAAAALQSRISVVLALAPVYGAVIARQSLSYFGGGAVGDVRLVGVVLLALTAVQLLAALAGGALGLGHDAAAVTLLHWLAEAQHVGLLLAIASAESSSTEQAAGIPASTGIIAPSWLLVSYIVFGPVCHVAAELWPQVGVMRWAWLATRAHIIASGYTLFGESHRGA